jgi:hypothetical protein
MGKLSKFFGKRIAKTFSDTLDEMSKFAKEVSEIDFEKEFENISSSFSEEFSRLKEMVVNKTNPYVVEVSYDRDKQTLSFTIDNNLLSIKVSDLLGRIIFCIPFSFQFFSISQIRDFDFNYI